MNPQDDTIGRRKAPLVFVSLGITAAYCAYIGFPAVFTGAPPYDDEGYLLATFRSYVGLGGLYSKTYTQYGPGYYSLFGTLFRVFGVDLLSLTPGRVVTLILLVAASSAGAIAVWLATRRLLVALAAQFFLFVFLRDAVAQPLHPGGYLVLLLALVAVTCFLPRRRWPLVAPVAMGMLLALMMTTKVNVGALALAGCVLAVASAHSSRVVRAAAGLLLVGIPLALMARDLDVPSVQAFALAVVLGAVVTHVVIADGPAASLSRKTILAFVGSTVIVSLLACLPVMIRGTSVTRLLDGAIIAPTRLPSTFSLLYPIDLTLDLRLAALVAAVMLVGAALVVRRIVAEPRASRVVGVLKLTGGTLTIAALALSVSASLPQTLVLTALGAVPLRRYSDNGLFGRRVLVMIAVLQPLHAYPVAGNSQIAWGSFLLALVAFITVADGLSEVGDTLAFAQKGNHRLSRVPTVFTVLLIVGVVLPLGAWGAASAYRTYDALPSLDLPGADRVHTDADQAVVYTRAAKLLKSNCDSFYSIPGLNSFHVFTQMPSVTGQNATAWPGLFDDQTQKSAVEDLRAIPGRLCILRNDVQLAFWQQGRPLRRGPLVKFVEQFSQEVGRAGDYRVLRRP